MVKTIGFDPVPETRQTKLWLFVLLAWKDAIFRIFDYGGRTSRRAFLISIIPVFLMWANFAWVSLLMPMDNFIISSLIVSLFVFAPVLIVYSLIIRRLHDAGNKASSMLNPLHLLNPFASLFSIAKLLESNDAGDNEFGPPHVLGYAQDNIESKIDPKSIG